MGETKKKVDESDETVADDDVFRCVEEMVVAMKYDTHSKKFFVFVFKLFFFQSNREFEFSAFSSNMASCNFFFCFGLTTLLHYFCFRNLGKN